MSFNSSSNFSLILVLTQCFQSRITLFIFTSQLIANSLILLLFFILVLYLGLKQWRQQRSGSAAAPVSHSNFVTYNMTALELIGILGTCLYCFGAYSAGLQLVGQTVFTFTVPAQTLFHLLTCVEHYLAVVHPITYLGLKRASGVRIRNISTGCIWLLCFGLTCLVRLLGSTFNFIIKSCLIVFSLIFVFYCSFSVARVLYHPGPRQVSRDRDRVDPSKQRAFYTIVTIMAAQCFRLLGILVCSVLFSSSVLTHAKCAVGASAMFLSVPCSLVLPLLYLQRAGKLGA